MRLVGDTLAVLRRLSERVGQVVSRVELLRVVPNSRCIRTAHGEGYRLTPDS